MTTDGRQNLIPAHGIITSPNKLGQTKSGLYSTPLMALGALRAADHVYMRAPGICETAPWFASKSPALSIDATSGCYVVPVKDTKWAIVFYFHSSTTRWVYAWIDTNAVSVLTGTPVSLFNSQTFQTLSGTARFNTTTNKNRIVFNAAKGVFVFDDLDPANSTAATARETGLTQPILGVGSYTSVTTGGAIANNKMCHVTCVVRRKFADGYEIISPPSSCIKESNLTGGSVVLQHNAYFSNQILALGDVLEFYRTRAQDYTGTTGTNTGRDYFLSVTHALTATDISNQNAVVDDPTPDANLGEALYTNSGEGTAAAAAFPPPTCKVVATFKGHTFYMNRTDAPAYTFRVPVYWGDFGRGAASGGENAYNRTYGVGARTVRGNTTSGSPTISSISSDDLIGIKVNQKQSNSSAGTFIASSRVTAVGATSVTMSTNATATLTGTDITLVDTIEIDGVVSESRSADFMFDAGGAYIGDLALILLDRVIPSPVTVSNGQTVPASEVTLTRLRLRDGVGAMTLRATNGANYVPALPKFESNETAQTFPAKSVPNGFSWSEKNEPENVPLANTGFAGSGEIYGAFSTRDAIWITASDGVHRLSGTGGSIGAEGYDWRVDPVDSSLSMSGPQAGTVLRDTPYLYTNRGLVRIESTGEISELSTGRLDDLLPGPPWSEPTFTAANAVYMFADQENFEIWFRETTRTNNRLWIYNTNTDKFTNHDLDVSGGFSGGNPTGHGCYSAFFRCALVIDTSAKLLKAPTDITSTVRYMQLKFQPVFGDDPESMYAWQILNLLMDNSDHTSGIYQIAYANGDAELDGLALAPAATFITAPSKPDSIYYRSSYSIARNAPSVANSIVVKVVMGAAAAGATAKLLGISYDFTKVSEQRNKR